MVPNKGCGLMLHMQFSYCT